MISFPCFFLCGIHGWYGAGAVFFWAPMMKWGLVAAGASEMNRPVEKVSVPQSLGTLRRPVVQRWACGQQRDEGSVPSCARGTPLHIILWSRPFRAVAAGPRPVSRADANAPSSARHSSSRQDPSCRRFPCTVFLRILREHPHSSGLHGHHLDPLVVCHHARQLELGGGQRVCRLHRLVPAAKGLARQAGRRGARRGARRRPRAATTGGRAAASPAACRFRVTWLAQRWAGQRAPARVDGVRGHLYFSHGMRGNICAPPRQAARLAPTPASCSLLALHSFFSTCALSYTCLLCHVGVSVLLWPPASARLYYVP